MEGGLGDLHLRRESESVRKRDFREPGKSKLGCGAQ